MTKNLNMTQGKPLPLLFSFALPLMFGNIFQQMYTVADTAIVGRGVGMDALAALGTVDWLNWMLLGLATGLTQGFSVRLSQKYGEGDLPALRRILGQSALLSAVIALLCVLLSQLAVPLFLNLLRVPIELRTMAALYIRILFGGFPAVMFFNFCSSMLRAIGGILLQSIVNGFGMAFIAGYTATNKLYGLLEIAALSYGYAVTTYVGQNYGAGEYTRIRKGVNTALLPCLATALAIALVMIAFGRPITGLFLSADDPAVLAQAADTAYRYLCVMAFALPALYLLYAYQSALQGLGQTAIGLIVGTLELCLRVGFALVSGAIGWAEGLFAAEVSAWIGGENSSHNHQ